MDVVTGRREPLFRRVRVKVAMVACIRANGRATITAVRSSQNGLISVF